MQNIKTIETQVPFLKDSFFTSTFKSRRKSSISNILRKQQHSLLNQQLHQQQCILEQHHQHPKQPLPLSAESRQGQRGRATSIPLCKTAECAGADGAGKEGQNERTAQRLREAAQWRKGEQDVSGSESVAVTATFIPASEELGEAASFSQLPSAEARKQRSGSPERAASQDDGQPRPQQHGLLAKGVRLLRNMGNQEAKQKKAAANDGASGDVVCDGFTDFRDQDKKSKKSHSKTGKGGGEHSGKKKSKSDSKASVFSGIRKSLAKAKGSKDELLEDGRAELKPAADANLSANERDGEGQPSDRRFEEYENELRRSSGSDADLYSFHSAAAENEDLLSDIQQAIKDHHVTTDGSLLTGRSETRTVQTTPAQQPLDLGQEAAFHCVASEFAAEERRTRESESCVPSLSSSGPGSPSESAAPSSGPDTERSSVSLFPKTNSTYSFLTSTSYESAEEPQDEPKSLDQRPEETANTHGSRVRLDQVGGAAGPMGSKKSVSSLDLSSTKEGEEEPGRRDFLSLKRRKSSLSISQLITDTQALGQRRTSSSSPSTVKIYPPIHPSYVKTTTRQLTSPAGSPLTSPHVPRKTCTSGGSGFKRHKQRSSSITGPISLSADWSSGQENPENAFTGGTYWTLGAKRAHYARRPSASAPTPYLDVFSGESDVHQTSSLLQAS